MGEKFESLPEEKRKKIMNAAYKVFSTHSYRLASTNEIVKEANISKGLLFHYFKNKEGLYVYLYKTAMNLVKEKLYEKMDAGEPDLLKRLRFMISQKIPLACEYPELFEFIKTAYYEEEPGIKQMVQEINNQAIEETYRRLYAGVDFSLFLEGIDVQLAIQTINAALEKWSEISMGEYKSKPVYALDRNEMEAKLDKYFSFFKKCFYKP